ncbi:calcium-binding protein [Streptomyces sp. BE308]|uniref:calcium-binding protein n=1 Tax=Streptomyces sp. BE308 TaxID=3002529 RepID=UPI002E77DFAA|nr:calcium-binding protein [Streptomyces sp. BE308]MEE1794561.1 calcium-binding protein [Streptomyces sp. BE308]
MFYPLLAAAMCTFGFTGLAASAAPQPTCDGKRATIVGTDGNDQLRLTSADDVVVAGAGDDFVMPAIGKDTTKGNDTICLGAGNDRMLGLSDRLTVFGGPGKDNLVMWSSATIYAGDDNDTVQMESGGIVDGGKGNDDIKSYKGAVADVTFNGDEGDDTIVGSHSRDHNTLNGGPGNDRISSEGGHGMGTDRDIVHGGPGNDRIEGEGGSDVLYGDDGNDTLCGYHFFGAKCADGEQGKSTDVLDGGKGNDALYGASLPRQGLSRDQADGGQDHDQCFDFQKARAKNCEDLYQHGRLVTS